MTHALLELPLFGERIAGSGKILLATDFDGTLCPLAEHPSRIQIAPETTGVLRQLAGARGVVLAIVSGRSLADIATCLDLDCVMAGNHGLEIRGPGLDFRHASADAHRESLALCCRRIAEQLPDFPGAWVEDKGLTATVHYRKTDPRLQRELLFRVRRMVSRCEAPFAMRSGKCALELRPRIEWDKGAAVRYIRERFGATGTTICLGDDRTDETMFRANPGGLNVRIGRAAQSAAGYYLDDPSQAAVLLSHILEVRGLAEVDRRSAAFS